MLSSWRPAPGTIPDAPGCYQFKDPHGRVIYVGKAKSLRSRLSSYFQNPAALHPRTANMVESAASVEWIVTTNEVESLHLEYNLIKTHKPRFNVRYRDDKSYPYLAVTISEEVPRAMVMRAGKTGGSGASSIGPRSKAIRYFGPYAHAYAIRETLDLLLRTFPIRTCSQGVFDRCRRINRPCLFYDIGKCSAPCTGKVSIEEHQAIVSEFIEFMDGKFDPVLDRLDKQMHEASETLEFERAARLRDQITSVRNAIEKQVVVSDRKEDLDVIAFAEDELEAALQVFLVRHGRLVGRKGFVVDKVEELDAASLLATFVRDLYMSSDEVPREILVPVIPEDSSVLKEWLGTKRGSKVEFRVPMRGDKRTLMQSVLQNANESFAQHKLKRRSDFAARAKQLQELQDVLKLEEAPLRIECYDISNTGPLEVVGSMVVFEDGLPKRSDYRKFKIRTVEGQDDFASMAEVIRRRFARYLADRDAPPEKGRRFAYPPNLVVVDGGRGQLSAALGALADLGIQEVSAVGLAKRFEEIWMPGADEPLAIPRGSEALYLLQHIRDEAHRFAITYHRLRRGKRMKVSDLDQIPGIGAERKRALIKAFGSVRRILAASEEEVAVVVGQSLARTVIQTLRGFERT
ncbi:MAG: excinuclease ABC subunit UvrC [Actinomycetota bacterium]